MISQSALPRERSSWLLCVIADPLKVLGHPLVELVGKLYILALCCTVCCNPDQHVLAVGMPGDESAAGVALECAPNSKVKKLIF